MGKTFCRCEFFFWFFDDLYWFQISPFFVLKFEIKSFDFIIYWVATIIIWSKNWHKSKEQKLFQTPTLFPEGSENTERIQTRQETSFLIWRQLGFYQFRFRVQISVPVPRLTVPGRFRVGSRFRFLCWIFGSGS